MWKDLSLKDKSALMQIMVNNGIYDLSTIRDTYNKFAEGGYVREKNNNPIAFDEEGNLTDQITGEKGTMLLPEVTVRGVSPETRARNYSSNFDGTFGLSQRDVYGMMPIIGDALDVKDIATDIYNGNYLNAGIGVGMFLLPNIIEKPLRKLSRVFKKPTKNVIESITNSNKFSITDQQWDAAYNKALQNNDLQEAQRLRDLHFEVSAPNTQIKDIQYHGAKGNAKFNVFNPKLIGQTDQGWAGRGYYFTPTKDYAKMYGSEPRAFYINAKKVHDGTTSAYFGREDGPAAEVFKRIGKKRGVDVQPILDDLISSDAIRTSFPQTKPYNGTFEEVVTRNNNQMKLADAVTYDDNGKIIPLSKRDNFNNPDIRYSLLPIGLTIGGAAYLNQKNKNK